MVIFCGFEGILLIFGVSMIFWSFQKFSGVLWSFWSFFRVLGYFGHSRCILVLLAVLRESFKGFGVFIGFLIF